MKALKTLVFLCLAAAGFALPLPVQAQAGFYIQRASCVPASPVTNQTWIYDRCTSTLSKWNGSEWTVITGLQNNLSASVAPTVNADTAHGYAIGSLWIDTAHKFYFVCTAATNGAAVWLAANRHSRWSECLWHQRSCGGAE